MKCEINKYILDFAEVGFKARAVITDDHPSNVNAFTWPHETFDGDSKTFIKHPAYADLATKTYLFFDVIHLFKNLGNNLLNKKKFVFPSIQFDLFRDAIHVPDCYISWRVFHEAHQRDENLQAYLRKAHKITSQVTHPGNNKQSVPLTLAIFQESTTATIKSYFPNPLDAVSILTLFYKVFVVCNSKQRFNTSNQSKANQTKLNQTKPNFFFLWQNWLKHGQNVHHLPLPSEPLMLL